MHDGLAQRPHSSISPLLLGNALSTPVPGESRRAVSALMAGRRAILLLPVLFAAGVGFCHGAAAYVTVSTASFTAGSTCNAPNPVALVRNGTSAVLRLTHRHGPCAPSRTSSLASPSVADMLRADQRRAEYIQRRVSRSGATKQQLEGSKAAVATVPASWGYGIGTLNYVVTVSLGTPGVTQTLEMDTGSDLSWVQCKPCAAPTSCYAQKDPLFDPAKSSTYSAVPCGGAACAGLGMYADGCAAGTRCGYVISYGDGSNTTGMYSSDTLTMTPNDDAAVAEFLFGCGHAQNGLFTGIDGLLGLGRQDPSLVGQTVATYGGAFSYCLPTTPNTAGYLTLGRPSGAFPTTQLLSSPNAASYYVVMLTGISVGGQELDVPASVFAGGTVVDSGTVITRLPPTAYAALRSAFRGAMAPYGYPAAPPTGILDTCYDFTGYGSATLPTVALTFAGDLTVTLGGDGILSFGCLAFAPSSGDGVMSILGNVQQRSFEVRIDGSSVGFKPNSC